MKTLQQNSESGSEESEYERGEEESNESDDSMPKSVVPVARGPSKKAVSKGKETADNVSRNGKGKEKCESYDLKSKGLRMASSSRRSLDAKRGGGNSKKNLFERVWSLEDEITLLNSVHEFELKDGRKVGPSTIGPFCYFLKGRLSFTEKPERVQAWKKIKALKKKYFYTVKSFTVEHDMKMKEIANRVWRPVSRKRGFPRLKEELRKLDLLDLEEKLISDERAVALEERLRMKTISGLKVALKRLELDKEILEFNLEKFQMEDVELKEELRKLDEQLISDERAVALVERLRMKKISGLKEALKRLELDKEILKLNLKEVQMEDVEMELGEEDDQSLFQGIVEVSSV